jgi:hypothetical protein
MRALHVTFLSVFMCTCVFIGFHRSNETTWVDQALLMYGGMLFGFLVSAIDEECRNDGK